MASVAYSPLPSEPGALPRYVGRALRAMRAAPGRAFDLAEIARIARTSERTLQRHFRKALGKSPLDVLADIRFEHARRELSRAPPGKTVAEIALRSGFTHLGRFSIAYARRYAEKPSQTLRRQFLVLKDAAPPKVVFSTGRDRPTIAVAGIEASEQNREVASSLADELANALTRAGMTVTEATSAARYRLHGSLRGEEPELRFTAQLIDAETACHLWSYKQDTGAGGDFLVEEHVVERIAALLQPAFRDAEVRRAYLKADTDVTAYDLTLRALPHAVALNLDGNKTALDLLGEALARDPDSPLAIALASWCHAQRPIYHFVENPAHHRRQAFSFAGRLAGFEGDATILAILGNTFALLNEIEKADFAARKALAICGGSSWAWARSGLIQVCKGHTEAALERFSIALSLAPNDPLKFNAFIGAGSAHFEAGNFSQAVKWFEHAILEHPNAGWQHELLCPAYFYSGRKAEAHRSLAMLRDEYPDLTIARVVNGMSFFTQHFRDGIANALDAVGLRA